MTTVDSTPPRSRGGGRAGRAALRAAQSRVQGPAFITRAIPPYELVGEEGIASIEALTSDFDCSYLGETTVTIAVTDYYGNVDYAAATVTVEDPHGACS